MAEKKVYQIDNKPTPKIEINNLNTSNSYFINEGYKKMQINFVEIESICDHCMTFFHSHFALHRHIKAGCNTLKRTTLAEIDSILSFARPIFYSKGGLAFKE